MSGWRRWIFLPARSQMNSVLATLAHIRKPVAPICVTIIHVTPVSRSDYSHETSHFLLEHHACASHFGVDSSIDTNEDCHVVDHAVDSGVSTDDVPIVSDNLSTSSNIQVCQFSPVIEQHQQGIQTEKTLKDTAVQYDYDDICHV